MTKLGFVKNVWEEIFQRQQRDICNAIFVRGDTLVLFDRAQHLLVDLDEYFSWSEIQRQQY